MRWMWSKWCQCHSLLRERGTSAISVWPIAKKLLWNFKPKFLSYFHISLVRIYILSISCNEFCSSDFTHLSNPMRYILQASGSIFAAIPSTGQRASWAFFVISSSKEKHRQLREALYFGFLFSFPCNLCTYPLLYKWTHHIMRKSQAKSNNNIRP